MEQGYHIIHKVAPSNIALIKYWGKHGRQLPRNPSMSITLQNSVTHTSLSYRRKKNAMSVEYSFEGSRNSLFENKIKLFLDQVKDELPVICNKELLFSSSNSFPHSAGIASSASSMAALALCIVEMEQHEKGVVYRDGEFRQRASYLARLASGSASRSLYDGWVTWGIVDDIAETSDLHASPYKGPVNAMFSEMGDAILIVSSEKKALSSTLGHRLMDAHPFADARYQQARNNLGEFMSVLKTNDFERFASIVEQEALTLHGLLMTSSEKGLLLQPNSVRMIQAIRQAREYQGIPVCFTIDAGPNVHLLYPLSERDRVVPFIENELVQFCENGNWIDDHMR